MRYAYRYDGLGRLVHAAGTYEQDTAGGALPRRFECAYAYRLNGNLARKDFIEPDTKARNDQ